MENEKTNIDRTGIGFNLKHIREHDPEIYEKYKLGEFEDKLILDENGIFWYNENHGVGIPNFHRLSMELNFKHRAEHIKEFLGEDFMEKTLKKWQEEDAALESAKEQIEMIYQGKMEKRT